MLWFQQLCSPYALAVFSPILSSDQESSPQNVVRMLPGKTSLGQASGSCQGSTVGCRHRRLPAT
jgi:hypothetical protein